jgi:hypothetical protein
VNYLIYRVLFLFRTVLIRQAAMGHRYHWLSFFIPYIFLANARHPGRYIPNFCFNDKNNAGRIQSFWKLNIYVWKGKVYKTTAHHPLLLLTCFDIANIHTKQSLGDKRFNSKKEKKLPSAPSNSVDVSHDVPECLRLPTPTNCIFKYMS